MNNSISKIILTTEHLVLRTWKDQDIPLMARISSDPTVMEFFPYKQDLNATKQFISRINEHFHQFGYSLYAIDIKATNQFIGFVGLNHPIFEIPHFIPQELPIVEIGWRISKDSWNKGYATEAAKAVLKYAFTDLNLNEIISFTSAINMRSRRVMEKIGLRHNATDDFNHPNLSLDNPLCKHVLYRLTRKECTFI